MTPHDEEPRVFRIGGISYVRIPAQDPNATALFYQSVFGWNLRGDPDHPSFDDGTGHVIGHFVADHTVAGEAGVRPYVYVERVDDTLEKVTAGGGEVVTPPSGRRPVGGHLPRPGGERARRMASRPARLTVERSGSALRLLPSAVCIFVPRSSASWSRAPIPGLRAPLSSSATLATAGAARLRCSCSSGSTAPPSWPDRRSRVRSPSDRLEQGDAPRRRVRLEPADSPARLRLRPLRTAVGRREASSRSRP